MSAYYSLHRIIYDETGKAIAYGLTQEYCDRVVKGLTMLEHVVQELDGVVLQKNQFEQAMRVAEQKRELGESEIGNKRAACDSCNIMNLDNDL